MCHCSVRLSPIAENSPLLPPVGVWAVPRPSVADHPLGPSTDHRLGKLLPHQLANQTRAPPRADSSFCSSAYGVLNEEDFVQHVLFDTGRRRTRLDIIKKRGEAELSQQVKMIWITPSSYAKDLTISEGTGATFLFNFHSRVPMGFHTLLLDLEKENGQILFLRNHTRKKIKVDLFASLMVQPSSR
ncbi:hypothetical protein ZIOFF_033598 [Zingiber officinale]|uniref:Uncharacterized protein n=1 Tax=Zingiber officinale TaxID=94328 RepID=A0A8J5GIH8_ZINOF|nr:hypothetical protein ZIOFF_033598 [Zingiber officinale]